MAAKFDRVAADIRQRITSNDLKPGDRLPPETTLMEEYGVALGTIRRAMALLEAEQHIVRVHGRGTFVQQRRTRVERSNDRYQWEKDRVALPDEERAAEGASERDTGLPADSFDFKPRYERTEADADLATAFGVAEGTPLLRRTFRTRVKEETAPFQVTISHLRADHIEKNPDLFDEAKGWWAGGTQHQLSTVGIEVARIEDRVLARPATSDEAAEFDITPGSPVVADRKTSISNDGEVVEVADNVWPADRIALTFTTNLEANRTGDDG
ncbi:GntR family transcriptional regulator [Nocardioides luteus]|uniref:Transcriptional regulator n=1 Tax=Nocardioides luteus TaxID=1844 RepID=A0ABQ5SUP3_9ACTN|nr:GntR family transcriptional regulator [Nocardioides luteus]MDR7309128.1 GntR family transcriptional regulator [Nocardioides luteus]GGR49602.1 transcriptional regulator [Nocardioides luteus]GLJ67534.1 transcriptional regulator [Nocardioides luteus]